MSSSSLLFSSLQPTSPSSSSSASSSSRPQYRRSSTFSRASTYSRDSWCSTAESEVSLSSTRQGHVSHDKEAFDKMVMASIAKNAVFGSTSPRKNRTTLSRSSTDSARSYASSSSSVRSPITPEIGFFSHPEHELSKTPSMASVLLPTVAEVPQVKRLHVPRLVSDEVQYIGRSLDVPVSEDIRDELAASIRHSLSSTSPARSSLRNSRMSTLDGKDGLKLALDELDQELARTMAALSTNTTPTSSISKARGKSMRRPHTADKVIAVDSAKMFPLAAFPSSASPESSSRFRRESWMSSQSNVDDEYVGNPIRFSASDLTLLAEVADSPERTSTPSRPESHISVTSSSSSRLSTPDLDSASVPALVPDDRNDVSSVSSSARHSYQEAPSRPDSFVTAAETHVPVRKLRFARRPGTAGECRQQPRGDARELFNLHKACRSVPSLTSEPPQIPLPPIPTQNVSTASPPPRPTRSPARTISPVNTEKPLPSLPC